MRSPYPPAGAVIAAHPLYSSFVSVPTVCFTLTLLVDIAYWQSSNLMWSNFAQWLLLAGLVVGGFVLLAQLVDLLFRARARAFGPGWPHALGLAVVLLLALVNSLVHARDGWVAVVPQGLILSAVTVVVMCVTGWFGSADVRRRALGVSIHD